jgi:hypothetical protein
LLLYRFDAPLFSANADDFRRRISDLVATTTPPIGWVVVAAEPITDVDTTAADVLFDLLGELQRQEVVLAFAEMKGPVKDRLRRYRPYDQIGSEHFFPTVAPRSTATFGRRARSGWIGRSGPMNNPKVRSGSASGAGPTGDRLGSRERPVIGGTLDPGDGPWRSATVPERQQRRHQ